MTLEDRLALVNDGRDLPLIAGLIGACLDAAGERETMLVEELERRAMPPALASQVLIKVLWRLDAIEKLYCDAPELKARLGIERERPARKAEIDWALAKSELHISADGIRSAPDSMCGF